MGSIDNRVLTFGLLALMVVSIVCPPLNPPVDDAQHKKENEQAKVDDDPILSLEYHKYLREIVNVLETDPNFKKVIEGASADDIKSGKIATNLDLVGHNVRTKLDELKRQEIERLRKLISRKVALSNLKPDDIESLLPKHIDHNNIETFEVNDLEKLIRQATTDLEEVDRIRREEFKQHELQKEFERRKKLEKLDPEMRKKLQEQHEKELEQKKHHEKVNHPGSKDQLEEVWEKQDHLEPDQFNPKTFFELHDIDNNKFLDQNELEAIFATELDKIHNPNDPDFDPVERAEEASRMREHVFKEIDKDKDKMISLNEFIAATSNREFEKNEEWKAVDEEPQFNQQEFENFSRSHMEAESTPAAPTTPSLNGNNNNNNNNNQNQHVNNQVPSNNQNQQQQQQHQQQQMHQPPQAHP